MSTSNLKVAVEGITLVREPAHTVTCLDQDLNSVRAGARPGGA